jgi:hypothetical protein
MPVIWFVLEVTLVLSYIHNLLLRIFNNHFNKNKINFKTLAFKINHNFNNNRILSNKLKRRTFLAHISKNMGHVRKVINVTFCIQLNSNKHNNNLLNHNSSNNFSSRWVINNKTNSNKTFKIII